MHVISVNNVREALPQAIDYLLTWGMKEKTRNGPALVAPVPVTIHYKFPKQHVLLNGIRNANPFFHLMEAMWMLAGRDDGQFLDHYVKGFSKAFGNKDGRIMDAYGYRWRYGLGGDQLKEIIQQLKQDLTTRQCVLQMWGAGRYDLLVEQWKPCNLNATFRVRDGKIDMLVQNRSNDLIWGCCGANVVHFSILLEYVAALSGLQLGEYWQVTSNLHMYEKYVDMFNGRDLCSPPGYEETMPLVADPATFDKELYQIMHHIEAYHDLGVGEIDEAFIRNKFLIDVWYMVRGYWCHKKHGMGTLFINNVRAEDWRKAGLEWMERRNGRG